MSAATNQSYDFFGKTDMRIAHYPLLSDPWTLIFISTTYLFSIYVFLPNYMSQRKPYDLKKVILVYNAVQIVICFLLIYNVLMSGWLKDYTLGCQKIGPPEDENAKHLANCMWATLLLKIFEMSETMFFILRKKFNQVSFLHVYHHVSTAWMAWATARYYPGGMVSMPVIINSFIHVLMYTYYSLASLGPEMQEKLKMVKSKLTTLQLIQFVLITVHSVQIVFPECEVPNFVGYFLISDMFVLFYYFGDFYVKSYMKKKEKAQ